MARNVYTTPHFYIAFSTWLIRPAPYFPLPPSKLKAAQWQGNWLQRELCFSQNRDSKTVAAMALQNVHKVGGMETDCSVS